MCVKKVKDVESTIIGAGQGTSRQILISPEQGPNFAMRKFVMQPGGDIPAHTNAVEHEPVSYTHLTLPTILLV